jgi:Transcriptional regulatory protein, C terminal/AAA ATPase domain
MADVAVGAVGVDPRTFVGREDELHTLEELLSSQDAPVVYAHGLAGIGKSTLLRALAERLRSAGLDVIALDCRTIEPTERGLLSALGADSLTAVKRLGDEPTTLVLDHYEVFRLMDTWLRHALVPALSANVRLMLAGREPPVAGWFASQRGFRSVPIGPLSEFAAVTLLQRLGMSDGDAARLNRIARGHPLALMLAAASIAERPELELEDAATGRVVDELARLYLAEVEDVRTRRALEAGCVVRRITQPLLAAMLDEQVDGATTDAFERLRELPFVDSARDGLVVHDAVRDAIGAFLRGANPLRHRAYRRAAWRELRDEVRDAPPAELWRYTADMLYLIENPVVREAFFPSGAQPLAVEPARTADGDAIVAIAERHEPKAAAALLDRWWAEAPETFSVVRDRDAVVTGFLSLLDTDLIQRSPVDGDPIVAAWAQHLREHPVPRGQVVLGLRRWLDAERGELPCATQAACWLDVKRTYMSLRPALRRIYVVVNDVATYWPIVEKLGFRPAGEAPVTVGSGVYASVVLDFGPGSVDGWLADLVGAELGVDDEPTLDDDARELSVQGQRVALTPLEFGLFNHLRAREGKAVPRGELLREVWGTEFTGGSNVVDVVVRSLRRKLGRAAPAVETVRGSGYRLRADWRGLLR